MRNIRDNCIAHNLVQLIICLLLTQISVGQVIYVDDDANGLDNGTSWTDAYNYLQDALANAQSGDEIWVAEGTYKPGQGGDQIPSDREATFQLINGVGLYGGFPSSGDANWQDRDSNLYETILSGDLDGDDLFQDSVAVIAADNCSDAEAILPGFTYIASLAEATLDGSSSCDPCDLTSYVDVWYTYTPTENKIVSISHNFPSVYYGSVISVHTGCPGTVANESDCHSVEGGSASSEIVMSVIAGETYYIRISSYYKSYRVMVRIQFNTENSYHVVTSDFVNENTILDGFTIKGGNANSSNRYRNGGGIYNFWSNPTLSHCIITGNTARIEGGGMYNQKSNPTIIHCIFGDNRGSFRGGGIYNNSSSPTVTHCRFLNNKSNSGGGGIYNQKSNPNIKNCTFSDNFAYGGGGVSNGNSMPIIMDCVFNANSAVGGGAICNESGNNARIIDCVFINNFASSSGGGAFEGGNGESYFIDCIFEKNSTNYIGGGIRCNNSHPTITNCIFKENLAGVTSDLASGGGIAVQGFEDVNSDSTIIRNCTIVENISSRKGGGGYILNSNVTIEDCIIWNNYSEKGSQMYLSSESSALISFCNIQGGQESIYIDDPNGFIHWGEGNIDVAPKLTPDGHLIRR